MSNKLCCPESKQDLQTDFAEGLKCGHWLAKNWHELTAWTVTISYSSVVEKYHRAEAHRFCNILCLELVHLIEGLTERPQAHGHQHMKRCLLALSHFTSAKIR